MEVGHLRRRKEGGVWLRFVNCGERGGGSRLTGESVWVLPVLRHCVC